MNSHLSPPASSQTAKLRGAFFLWRFRPGVIGLLILGAVFWVAGTHTVDGVPRAIPAAARFLVHAPAPTAWMLSAFGVGLFLSRMFGLRTLGWQVALALGVAALMSFDALLGALGFFGMTGSVGPMVALLPGVFWAWREYQPNHGPRGASGAWLAWTLAPAVAILCLAASTAPGWLWSTEFGGYDALSYHLQLPREWLALGRVETLAHNVYSTFPSFQESATLHLMALRANAHRAALDAQILHAFLALAAAACVGKLAQVCCDRAWAGTTDLHRDGVRAAVCWSAAAIFLGLPWIIVTGSLAYNEMPMVLMFAAAAVVALSGGVQFEPWALARTLAALALLCAAAMGAKLTAALFVVAPIAFIVTIELATRVRARELPLRAVVRGVAIAVLIAVAVLSPWWLRNAYMNGSPFFPLFGSGGLSVEQLDTFNGAHRAISASNWWKELCEQWLLAGLTEAGPAGEPWRPFWSVLPWISLACAIVLVIRRTTRRIALVLVAVVLIQIACWLLFTHAKGRFLIPTAVPLAVLASIAAANLVRAGWLGRTALCSLLLLWCTQPMLAYVTDGPLIDGAYSPATGIGIEPLLTGDAGGDGLPAVLARLGPKARVVSLGATNVFWWPVIPSYSTVWDTNPVALAFEVGGIDTELSLRELRRAGFTHLVIDETMLNRWTHSGWLDKRITPDAVDALVRTLKPICNTGGTVVFELGRE